MCRWADPATTGSLGVHLKAHTPFRIMFALLTVPGLSAGGDTPAPSAAEEDSLGAALGRWRGAVEALRMAREASRLTGGYRVTGDGARRHWRARARRGGRPDAEGCLWCESHHP